MEYKVLQTGADVLELKYTSQDKQVRGTCGSAALLGRAGASRTGGDYRRLQININEVASLEWGGLSGLGGEATIVWRGQRFVDPNRFARFVYQVKLRELKQQMAGRESGGDPGGVTEVSRVKGWQTVKDAVSKQSLEASGLPGRGARPSHDHPRRRATCSRPSVLCRSCGET